MAKRALILKQQRKPKFRVRIYNRCRLCGRPILICGNLAFVDYALENLLTRGKYQELEKQAGSIFIR